MKEERKEVRGTVVMSSRKTETRVRVSLSLKGQGGRGSCRHEKITKLLAKNVFQLSIFMTYTYIGFQNSGKILNRYCMHYQ